MGIPIQAKTDNRGFATPLTPITNGGMLRYNRSTIDLVNDWLNGETAIRRLKNTAPSILTLSSDTITTTLNAHYVAAQTGTADDLSTITAANNQYVFLRADTGDTITIKHGTGNITIPGGNDIVLTGYRGALLFCENSQWSVVCAIATKANLTATSDPGTGDDTGDGYAVGSLWINAARDRIWICVDNTATAAIWKWISQPDNEWGIRAAAATVQPIGIAAPTLSSNSPGGLNANSASGTFWKADTVLDTNAAAVGLVTASFDLVRPQYDPIVEFLITTDVALTNQNIFVGLTSANIISSTDVTNLAASAIKFIGFRFSSGDTGFKPILSDGSTQSAGSAMNTVATSTAYKLSIRIASGTQTAYMRVDNGAEVAVTSHFPATSTDMGLVIKQVKLATGGAVVDTILMSYAWVGW